MSAFLVWWHWLENGTFRNKLNRFLRAACIATAGALKITPKEALFAMEAWKSTIRLSITKFRSKPYGHHKNNLGKRCLFKSCPTQINIRAKLQGLNSESVLLEYSAGSRESQKGRHVYGRQHL